MKIAIIKYNAGNTRSVAFALERLGVTPLITDNPAEIISADKVIFPGVGEASNTMNDLNRTGLHTIIPMLRQPVLGICLGMQLMCKYSAEGDTHCLGIFDHPVLKFENEEGENNNLKIPHMGWNSIHNLKKSIFSGIEEKSHLYFVHSYYIPLGDFSIASCNYISEFSAALQKNNFYAVQFHPEKSGEVGLRILSNFLNL